VKTKKTDHMCVKMEDCDWLAIGPLQGAKSGEGDGVIAAKGDEFRVDVRCGVGIGQWSPGQEFEVGFRHLADGEGVVEGRDGDVAAV
jgi:hypothetical protein